MEFLGRATYGPRCAPPCCRVLGRATYGRRCAPPCCGVLGRATHGPRCAPPCCGVLGRATYGPRCAPPCCAYGTIPSSRALLTASARRLAPSFSNSRATWVLTVLGETWSASAISLVERPAAISRSTASSRSLMPSEAWALGLP